MREIQPEELYEDFMPIVNFTIFGPPRTKKNSQRAFRGIVLPSKQYVEYEKIAKTYCEQAWDKKPIDYGVGMKMSIYLDKWIVGDCVGYHQSLMDILQKWKVVEDDKWIHTTDYNIHTKQPEHWFKGIDKENPRAEIELFRFKHPYEEYRTKKEREASKKLL